MKPRDVTLVSDPVSVEDRKGLLEVAWLMTALVVLLAVALPWFFHALEIDLQPIAWTLFGFAALSVVASRTADRWIAPESALGPVTTLHALGILMLAGVWHLAGGTGNSPFLVLFVLPVLASFLTAQRLLPYISAGLAIAAVTLVALAESPGLRWYLVRLGVPLADRLDVLSGWLETTGPGLYGTPTPPALLFVTLIVFALALVSVAFIGESLTALLLGLYGRLATSSLAREDAELLYNKLLHGSPDPAVVVFTDSARVVQASNSFVRDLMIDRESVANQSLFDLVDFSYPDVVRAALKGGEVPFAVYRIDGETRVGRLHVWQVRHADTAYTFLTLRDVTDAYYLHAALDSVDEPYLVIGDNERLVYFNQAASELFGGLQGGDLARAALARRAQPTGWWEIGLRQRHARRIEVAGQAFDVALSLTDLPGEAEKLTVARMRRAAGS